MKEMKSMKKSKISQLERETRNKCILYDEKGYPDHEKLGKLLMDIRTLVKFLKHSKHRGDTSLEWNGLWRSFMIISHDPENWHKIASNNKIIPQLPYFRTPQKCITEARFNQLVFHSTSWTKGAQFYISGMNQCRFVREIAILGYLQAIMTIEYI